MASRQPDEEEPLLRRSGRSGIETRTSLSGDRFYCGAPPVPERYRWEYTVIFCTCFICCLFFVAIPILALLITGDRTCDKSRLEGVKPPFDGQIMPPEPVMVEYYTDWYQYSKLFDVYDGTQSNASQATRVGYFYYMNILSFLRFGYSEEGEVSDAGRIVTGDRVWFEGKYTQFGSRLKPYADLVVLKCDEDFARYQVVEDFWDRTWFCWSRCRRTFHVTKRETKDGEFKPYAEALFYDAERYYDTYETPETYDVRYMNLTAATTSTTEPGPLLATATLRLGNAYTQVGLDALNRWLVDYEPNVTKKPKSPPEHWLVGFVTAMDDVPNRSVAWLLALVVGGCICCLCWLQRQEEQRYGPVPIARRYD